MRGRRTCTAGGPWETVYWWFARWSDDGSLDACHDTLRVEVRRSAGRNNKPTAG